MSNKSTDDTDRPCPECDGQLTDGGWCNSCPYGWRLHGLSDTGSDCSDE